MRLIDRLSAHVAEPHQLSVNRQDIVDAIASIYAMERILKEACATLQISEHLLLKYCPEHEWIPEHQARIEELKKWTQLLS